MSVPRLLALSLFLAVAATGARAEGFSVALRGFPVGTLHVDAEIDGGRFDFKSQFQTTGVVGILARVRFLMRSTGTVRGHMPEPVAYAEQMNTGARVSDANIRFAPGDPRWDPNTALVYAFTPRPVEAGCALRVRIFDGARTTDVVARETTRAGGRVICRGALIRVDGFSAAAMADTRQHAFTATYEARGDRLVLAMLETETDYGPVTLTPR